ncbi:Na(+)/H(+) antiporter subunit B [Ornithinibacillus gellani]|uniref:Na(+)/H(+) antiporter subunit B n=1 Tax=Ornithinibacillus gellani TaxID=2293253 RepID=UPI000F49A154|nr:Na(+)/H(+) antiporter subunit B [Ornithinibacillus gellani]TQS71040.1 Na(+)/H(+) antiporter subunit B [Ornithinibacillus gellani]
MKTNDVILQMITKIVVFIILTLAVYLFFAGHHNPGGGFIAGLVLSSAFVLLFLAFDTETIIKGLPLNFKVTAAVGALLAISSGIVPTLFGHPFLNMVMLTINLPLIGKFELGTIVLFEAGVALAVVGVVVTIILSISEDV